MDIEGLSINKCWAFEFKKILICIEYFLDGFLFIAIVLPFNPYVERGGTGESKPITDVSHYQCKSRKYPEQLKCFVSAVEKW